MHGFETATAAFWQAGADAFRVTPPIASKLAG